MNESDFSWLHLSDFHIGKDEYAQRSILRYILDEIAAESASGRKPDFVFITGDLANKGLESEFSLFDNEFVIPLIEILGEVYISRIFIIPGNHDVDRTKARSAKRYDILQEIPYFLDPTDDGLREREYLLNRFSAFDTHSWYLENFGWLSQKDGYLARRVSINKLEIGILCINTAWLCGSDDDFTKLTPGFGMVESGLRELEGCAPVIVLGHHPLEWFTPPDTRRLKSLLAKHGAIYLHGHLHKTEHVALSSGAVPLVAIQCGCAFNARHDEKWLTRIIWGGYDSKAQSILVRPKKWSDDHSCWILDADAFSNELRKDGGDYWILPTRYAVSAINKEGIGSAKKPGNISPPEGWAIVDESFLLEHSLPVSEDKLIQYFDGRVPLWDDILTGKIPERAIVEDLVSTIASGFDCKERQLTLLLGAGGEGKTTAILQTVRRICVGNSARILWRTNPERQLPSQFVVALAASDHNWLIATDEADSLVGDVYNALRGLGNRTNIHFLLACRDTDWLENRGNEFTWNQVSKFVERRMKGLEEVDARLIIEAWGKLGARGLGKLSGLDADEATAQLLDAARLEASSSDGAFLGAMLRVRVGVALKDHVAALMGRLELREIQGYPGKTLLDAFALIAIPHSNNVLFLSKPVLAKALGIEEARLRRRVLGPLGEEAAATSVGHFVLTRHRAIAQVAEEIAANRFNFDSDEILSELVRAAILLGLEGALVPQLADWRYLSAKLFDQGSQALGVKLAATALSADPRNSYLAVKLSNLYREAGQPEQSAQVFRNSVHRAQGNRGFFTEWGTCEASLGNQALSVWLKAIAIADGTEMRPPDLKDVGFGLPGCAISFVSLYERYQNTTFLRAVAASNQLSRRITLPRVAFELLESCAEKLAELLVRFEWSDLEAFEHFLAGVYGAYDQREIDISAQLPRAFDLHFAGLRRILRIR